MDRLVIVDSPGREFSPTDEAALLARFGATKPEDIFVPTSAAGVRTLIDLAYVHPPPTPHFLLADLYKNLFTEAADQKRRLLLALQADRAQLTAEWNVNAPALVIWGKDDPVFPPALGQKLADDLHAKLVLIPGAHAPNVEYGDDFNTAIASFLSDHP